MSHSTAFNTPSAEKFSQLFPQYQNFVLVHEENNSVIYKAHSSSTNQEVAIKVLLRAQSEDESIADTFTQESKLVTDIKSDSIVRVLDSGKVEDYLFQVMEYFDAPPLYYSIHGIAIDPETTTEILLNICNGLEAAHNKGLVHRNINPKNVMVTQEVELKIIGFGIPINKSLLDGSNSSDDSAYLAPELIANPNLVDPRCDIYSVGILLKQMLTGTLPPHFNTDANGAPLSPELPEEFQTIIDKATAQSPAERYASIGTMTLLMREALSDLQDGNQDSFVAEAKAVTPVSDIEEPEALELPTAAPASAASSSLISAASSDTIRTTSSHLPAPKNSSNNGLRICIILVLLAALIGVLKMIDTRKKSVLEAENAEITSNATSNAKNTTEVKDKTKNKKQQAIKTKAVTETKTVTGISKNQSASKTPFISQNKDIVFDFETGDLQGAKITSGKFGHIVTNRRRLWWNAKRAYRKQGDYFLSTYELEDGQSKVRGTDKQKGVIKSPVFKLTKPNLSLLIGGGTDKKSTYFAVHLEDGEEIYRTANTKRAEQLKPRKVDLSPYLNKNVYWTVVDNGVDKWDYISVDNIVFSDK